MELTVENLGKQYKEKEALKNVSFSLKPGIYGLLGPNGAGKSTLMNIIAGLLKPTSGRLRWNGRDIRELGTTFLEVMGFQPQAASFYGDFTGRQFLDYMSAVKGLKIKGKELDRYIEEKLDVVGLLADADRKIKAYSGGMKQRLSIAQALLNDPALLLLDEPTAGLDPKERVRLRNTISELSTEKIVLWSTHIVSDIEFLAQRVILLKEGRIIHDDTPQALTDSLYGKVYTAAVKPEEVELFYQKYSVTGVRHQGNEAVVRFITDLPADGTIEAAGLEDVYMYCFKEQGKAPETESEER